LDTDSIPPIQSGSFFPEVTVEPFLWVLIAILVFIAAFVSYCESSFAAIDNKNVLVSKYSLLKRGKQLVSLLHIPERLLFVFITTKTILLLASITVALLLFSVQSPIGLLNFYTVSLTVLLSTISLFIFVQVIPHCMASGKISTAIRLTPYVYLFDLFSRPVVASIEGLLKVQRNLFPYKRQELTLGELSKVMDLTKDEIDEGKDLLEGLIGFNDKSAVEIMTPREDMACLDISVTLSEITRYVLEMHYSRIPIYDKSEDNIRGILYVKDLLPVIEKGANYRWQQLIRPAFFVPETKKIDALLKEFRSNKIHLAIVVDEYGGTSGLVTMEDVLEEIVGEISDEYDEEHKPFVQLADGSLIFEGKTLLTDFFRSVDVDESVFDELTEEVDTLAGLILELKGDFPRRQEVITYSNYQFQVLEMSKRRIVKVKFNILDPEQESES
jgi:gliding motility-associated protein GldE